MINRLICAIACLLMLGAVADAAQIAGPYVRNDAKGIYVASGLALDEQEKRELRDGVQKEIDLYLDLYRVWRMWPDEFVLGVRYTQTLRCDPVRKEYVATSLTGSKQRERRFTDCDALMGWALSIPEILLTHTGELDPAEYFVKVTAESRLRRLPPFIGQMFFFVPQREFHIEGRSSSFVLGAPAGGQGGVR